MIKFDYASDLHLEFDDYKGEIPGGDVLLLAGDISLYNHPKNKKAKTQVIARTKKFFQKVSKKYQVVLYVLGNHEHYFSDSVLLEQQVRDYLKQWNCDNVHLLNNETYITPDFAVFGSTFWTDINGKNPVVIEAVKTQLNDFVVILKNNDFLTPHDTTVWNDIAREKLEQFLSLDLSQPRIVLTHHAPFTKSSPPQYLATDANYCFCNTHLEYTSLLDHDVTWVHGHIHTESDYTINDRVRVLANPRGYPLERAKYEFKQFTV